MTLADVACVYQRLKLRASLQLIIMVTPLRSFRSASSRSAIVDSHARQARDSLQCTRWPRPRASCLTFATEARHAAMPWARYRLSMYIRPLRTSRRASARSATTKRQDDHPRDSSRLRKNRKARSLRSALAAASAAACASSPGLSGTKHSARMLSCLPSTHRTPHRLFAAKNLSSSTLLPLKSSCSVKPSMAIHLLTLTNSIASSHWRTGTSPAELRNHTHRSELRSTSTSCSTGTSFSTGPLCATTEAEKSTSRVKTCLPSGDFQARQAALPLDSGTSATWRSFHLWRYSLRFSSVPIRTGFMSSQPKVHNPK